MTDVIIPSNPADQKKILDFLQEVSNSFTRIQAEKDYIKEAVDVIVEEYELPKKYVNKMARVFHKNTFQNEVAESENFQLLYENITKQTVE
jgi:hypothetical protein